jgi:hypothetical protein
MGTIAIPAGWTSPGGTQGDNVSITLRRLVANDYQLHVLWKTERQSVRLSVGAINVANRPNFQVPLGMTLFTSTSDRAGSAGRITHTTTASRQIQFALKWMF